MTKATHSKPIANITQIGKTQTISTKIRSKMSVSTYPILIQSVLKILAREIKQEQEIKGI